MDGVHADALASQQKIVDEFNKQSTDTEVTSSRSRREKVTDSAKLITAVRGGTGPERLLPRPLIVAERAANGLLQDLTKLLEANNVDTELSDYIEFAAKEASYNGAPYALAVRYRRPRGVTTTRRC